jgi:hypothetical protein
MLTNPMLVMLKTELEEVEDEQHLILNFFCLKVKVKVDLLKLMLKLVFHQNHFQILREKHSKSFYLEKIKVRPRDDYME